MVAVMASQIRCNPSLTPTLARCLEGDPAVETRAALGLWLRSFVGLAAAARSLQAVDPAAVGPEATAHLLTAMVRQLLGLHVEI